jgi:hypothetical protein
VKQNLRKKSLTLSKARWLTYAAAAAATPLGSATSSEAEIHYSGVIDSKFLRLDVKKKFDLDDGARLIFVFGYGVDFNGTNYYGAWFGIHGAAVSNQFRGYLGQFTSPGVSRLGPGKAVSQGEFFEKFQRPLAFLGSSYGAGAWGTRTYGQGQGRLGGFIGFRFDNGDGKQYGWARLKLAHPELGIGFGFTLVDNAWGDPGDAIMTGQTSSNGEMTDAIPNSGSLGLLAHGGPGLQAWRNVRAESSK